MNNDLQRAVAEGLITLLDGSRGHPARDDLIDRKVDNIRAALDAEKVCKHCKGTGECYYGFIEGTPIASSLGPCVCVEREPDGPPGCQCAEKTRASADHVFYDCHHCRP